MKMETKEEIILKLEELGIKTLNAYPKKSFLFEDVPCVSLYKRELQSSFYFYNPYDEKLYVLPFTVDYETKFQKDIFGGATKYIVPLSECTVVYEDIPFKELEDTPFKDMTLRDYACIHLSIPESNHAWLNDLIRNSK